MNQAKTNYTPQFVINVKEYRKWFSNKSIPTFKKEYEGNLKVNSNFPQYNAKNNETKIVVWISEYNSNILQSVATYL